MRTIGVVTVARSDYGVQRPLLQALAGAADLRPALVVAGTHLDAAWGDTVREIESDGFEIAARVETVPASDEPLATAEALGRATAGFADALDRLRPDVVLVLGDRWEMLAAASAALPLRLPVAHLHGGERSEGAFDESIRHAVTKLAHLHFASTEEHARRVRQLGEEPWRVVVSGAPALDAIAALEPLPDGELEERIGLPLEPAPLVVTWHPATLDDGDVRERAGEVLAAVADSGLPAVLTFPGADPGGASVRGLVQEHAGAHAGASAVASLGSRAYFSLLRRAVAMVGNSSSGILEAASFRLPVVNVGDRQEGRLRAANVIDVPESREQILEAIRRATSAGFRASLASLVNPYGDGRAAARIVETLRTVPLGRELLVKRFVDVDA